MIVLYEENRVRFVDTKNQDRRSNCGSAM